MKLIRRDNGYYYVRIKGQRPKALGTKNKEEAERIAKDSKMEQVEQLGRAGLLTSDTIRRIRKCGKTKVSEAIETYRNTMRIDGYRETSIHRTVVTVRKWASDIGMENAIVSDIERKHIDAWVNPSDCDLKYSSRVRNLAALVSFFRFIHHQGWTYDNAAAGIVVRRDKLRQSHLLPKIIQPFTEDEVRKIVASQEPGSFWHFATICSWHTGLRMGDIANLEWINIQGDHIMVSTSKAQTLVQHEMTEELRHALSKVPQASKTYLFPEQAKISSTPSGQARLSNQFKRLVARLGIDGKHFHCLRHSYALRKKQSEKRAIFLEMLEQLSDKGVMQALGHKAMTSTKIYLNHET